MCICVKYLSLSHTHTLTQGKREKKSGKKSKKVAAVVEEEPSEPAATGGGGADLFDLDMGSQQQKPPETRFQLLAEDENIKMVQCILKVQP